MGPYILKEDLTHLTHKMAGRSTPQKKGSLDRWVLCLWILGDLLPQIEVSFHCVFRKEEPNEPIDIDK